MALQALLEYSSSLRDFAESPPTLLEGKSPQEQAEALAEQAEVEVARSTAVTQQVDATNRNERDALTVAAAADLSLAAHFLAEAEEREPGVLLDDRPVRRGPIHQDFVEMAEAMERVARGEAPPSTTPEPKPDADATAMFKTHVDAILKAGGDAIGNLIGSVGWSAVGTQVGAHLDKVLGASDEVWSGVVAAAKGAFQRLRRAALHLFKAGVDKLVKLVGSDALDTFVANAKDRFEEWIEKLKDTPGGLPGAVVAQLVDANAVAGACADTVKGQADPVVKRAGEAAKKVADHAADQAKWMNRSATLVSWGGAALWRSPAAPYLAGAIVVAIAVVGWQVQDHLDTTEPFQMADLTLGVQRAVKAAVET